MLKSWNEWAEGNYMEPDLVNNKNYIYALRNAIDSYVKQQDVVRNHKKIDRDDHIYINIFSSISVDFF